MKRTLLTIACGLALFAGDALAQETQTVTFPSVADTWIDEGNLNSSYSNAGTIEIQNNKKSVTNDAGEVIDTYSHHAGLIGFDLAIPEGMKVKSASLQLVTERVKFEPVSVYGYPNNFAENANWGTEEKFIEEALAGEPVVKFKPVGQWNKAIFDGLNEEYRVLDKWVNNLDVTSYVKSLGLGAKRVNFFFYNDGTQTADCRFYTKDAGVLDSKQNETNNYEGYENLRGIQPEQLMPYLIVEFEEDASISTSVATSVADTWIRKGNTTNRGGDGAMEIYYTTKTDEEGATVRDAEFYGLMAFELPEELNSEEYKLESATLRLTCTFNKGNRVMNIYDYENVDFAEGTKFETENSYVAKALANEPIVSFEAQGRGNNAMGNWLDKNNTVESWQSTLDLTKYIAEKKGKFAILFSKNKAEASAIKFATKEATDNINKFDNETGKETTDESKWTIFKAEDLVPQLTIVYSKVEKEEPTPEPEPETLAEFKAENWVAGKNWNGQFDCDVNPNNGHLEVTLKGDDKTEMYGTIHHNEPVTLVAGNDHSILRVKGKVSKVKTNLGIMINGTYCEVNDHLYTIQYDSKNDESLAYCNDVEKYSQTYTEKFGTALEYPHELKGSKGSDKLVYENGWYGYRLYVAVGGEEPAAIDTRAEGDNPVVTVLGHKLVSKDSITKDGKISYQLISNQLGGSYTDPTTGVEAVEVEGEAVYYNLQGVRVENPTEGLYICVKNGQAAKVLLRK